MHTHTHSCACAHTCTEKQTYTPVKLNTSMHANARRTHTHTHTHTQTHTHNHTVSLSLSLGEGGGGRGGDGRRSAGTNFVFVRCPNAWTRPRWIRACTQSESLLNSLIEMTAILGNIPLSSYRRQKSRIWMRFFAYQTSFGYSSLNLPTHLPPCRLHFCVSGASVWSGI